MIPDEIAVFVERFENYDWSDTSHDVVITPNGQKFLLEKGSPKPEVSSIVVLVPVGVSACVWSGSISDYNRARFSLDGTPKTFMIWKVKDVGEKQ